MRYWMPKHEFIDDIIRTYGEYLRDGDVLAVSEKALAVALGHIYDESIIKENKVAVLATELVRRFWILMGERCRLKEETLDLLKRVPSHLMARHKQLALSIGGLKHFLKPVSEAGIDTSNLPYSYVSLPVSRAKEIADSIRESMADRLGKEVKVLVQDTDKTFLPKNICLGLATRPSQVEGIIDLGVVAYVLGMCTNGFKAYPTPVAYSGPKMNLKLLLSIARAAESSRGWGTGRNVMEMAERFDTSFEGVTWRMLEGGTHLPVVVVRLQM